VGNTSEAEAVVLTFEVMHYQTSLLLGKDYKILYVLVLLLEMLQ